MCSGHAGRQRGCRGGYARRLKAAVADETPYTVSVGGAVWTRDGDTWDTCCRVADEGLYEDKRRA